MGKNCKRFSLMGPPQPSPEYSSERNGFNGSFTEPGQTTLSNFPRPTVGYSVVRPCPSAMIAAYYDNKRVPEYVHRSDKRWGDANYGYLLVEFGKTRLGIGIRIIHLFASHAGVDGRGSTNFGFNR